MNTNNQRFDESLISAYLDGELSEQERLVVESAIQESPPLQKLVRELSTVRSLVAVSSDKSASLSRSLQSSEWTSSSAPHAQLSPDRDAIVPASELSSLAKRHRVTIGILASLAAVLLIFLTNNFLIDKELAVAPQIALESNAQKASSEIEADITSSHANENQTVLQSSADLAERAAPPVASSPEKGSRTKAAISPGAVMATPPSPAFPNPMPSDPTAFQPTPSTSSLSAEAQSLFVYLEQRLNANEDGPNSVRWKLEAKDNLSPHAFDRAQTLAVLGTEHLDANTEQMDASTEQMDASTQQLGANTQQKVMSASRDPVKEISVERGESEEEFVINLTRDEAQKFYGLSEPEQTALLDLANVDELLAIAKPAALMNEQQLSSETSIRGEEQNPPDSPTGADTQQPRKWDLVFTIPAPGTPSLAGVGKLGTDGIVAGGVGAGGASAGGFGAPGVGASGVGAATSMEFGPTSPNVGLPSVGYGNVEASKMQTTTRAESQRPLTANSTQTNRSRLNKTNQAVVPADVAHGASADTGEIHDQPAKEKPIRIRIKIKKEPGSSDSNE